MYRVYWTEGDRPNQPCMANFDELKQAFNRDRKQIDLKILRDKIRENLSQLELFDDNESMYEDLNDTLISILEQDSLEEFDNIKVLRNIISQFNNTEQYIFIGKREKKFDKQIETDGLNKIVIGPCVMTKFKVRKVSDLYHKNKFYTGNFERKNNIKTTMIYKTESEIDEEKLRVLVTKLLEDLEKKITIRDELKEKLKTIKIKETTELDEDTEDEDDNNEIGIETDDDDNIYVCKNLIENRIRFGGCLAAYILKNSDHNLEIADLLGEMFFGQNKKWFNLF